MYVCMYVVCMYVVYVCSICMYYMYVVYVCSICIKYMYVWDESTTFYAINKEFHREWAPGRSRWRAGRPRG